MKLVSTNSRHLSPPRLSGFLIGFHFRIHSLIRIGSFLILAIVSAPAEMSQEGQSSLLRFPDMHRGNIAFVHAGDIYLVDADGGVARQLTSHKGQELFPKFSPDGKWIAFSAE